MEGFCLAIGLLIGMVVGAAMLAHYIATGHIKIIVRPQKR